MNVDFFDPEMCCATGVCGASPDPELIRVGELVKALQDDGHTVSRHMLSRDSAAFASNKQVYEAILKSGVKALPIVVADGRVVTMGRYPQIDEMRVAKET